MKTSSLASKSFYLLLLLFAAISSQAQSNSAAHIELAEALRPACEQLAERTVTSGEIASVLQVSPVLIGFVCDCARAKFLGDKRISQSLQIPVAEIQALAKTPSFKSYVIARYLSATFECLATEINSSLDFSKLR